MHPAIARAVKEGTQDAAMAEEVGLVMADTLRQLKALNPECYYIALRKVLPEVVLIGMPFAEQAQWVEDCVSAGAFPLVGGL